MPPASSMARTARSGISRTCSWGQIINQPVGVTVARYIVSTSDDLPDDTRVLLSQPAEHEKRCFDTTFVKQIEDSLHLAYNPRW